MSQYSVKIETIAGTSLVRVWVRYTETPENDTQYVADWNAGDLLTSTPVPAVDRRDAQSAICELTERGLIGVVIFPTREGWGTGVTLCSDETQYVYGEGSTPADAIRNSRLFTPLLPKPRRRRLKQ